MAIARETQSTLFPEKETRRRSELFFNRMKVRLQLETRYIDLSCTVFLSPQKRGGFTLNKSLYGGEGGVAIRMSNKLKSKYAILTEKVTPP